MTTKYKPYMQKLGFVVSYLKYYSNCFCLQVTLVDYTFFCRSLLLLDASYDEERISEGQMVIAMNKHREICALHMSGTHLLHKDQVCAALAYRLLHGVWIWRCFFSKTPHLTVE